LGGLGVGGGKIPYSAVVQLIEPSNIGRRPRPESQIGMRNYWLYDQWGCNHTSSERVGCSCGHQTCMDFLDVRAPNSRLPHHTGRARNRMCQKCLLAIQRNSIGAVEARLFGRDSRRSIGTRCLKSNALSVCGMQLQWRYFPRLRGAFNYSQGVNVVGLQALHASSTKRSLFDRYQLKLVVKLESSEIN
jgi:hypothetical protein